MVLKRTKPWIQDLYATTAQWRKQWFREIKVFKKCPKVNPYCNAIFDPILFKPFLYDAKLPKFCVKYFFSNWSNIGCFWWICLWKLMKGWSEIYEIHTMDASCHAPKKTRKRQITSDSPSLWILHLKYTNIFTSWSVAVEIFGTEVFGEHSTRPQDNVRFIFLKM